MRSPRASSALATLALVSLLRAVPSAAQESPATAEARVRFDRAVALFGSGDASGALAEFQRAYELSGRASVLYNIGASHQALHDYPRAIEALRQFLAATEGRPSAQREHAGRALRQMEPLVAQLRIVGAPPGAAVTLDGRAVTGDRATVGPGAHVVTATAPGHEPARAEVTVVSGDDRAVDLTPQPLRPAAAPPATAVATPAPAPPPTVTPAAPPGRVLFWSLVVGGGALALGATVTGTLAVVTQQDYASRRVDDPSASAVASRGRALALTADVLGVAAIGAGAAALVVGLRSAGRRPPAVGVVIGPTRGGASVGVSGSF